MSLTPQSRKLQVDFSWRRFKGLITDANDTTNSPLYVVHWNAIKSPHMTFKGPDDKQVIGTGTLHLVRINADYVVNGRSGTLVAQKRFKTLYTHESHAYADPETGEPVTLTWTSDSGFTTWDFICVDEHQRPVAKYTAKIWGVKKIGYVEFMDDRPLTDEMRDEIVVTGVTLFYCMWLRVNNIFSLFGSAFHSTPPAVQEKTQLQGK
ncbi:hypothetical protein BJY01DRAFT_219603 [Aspergillus pseudoustus]|uniref:Uncharacterized protein n=1 Tax=Aspergillus pseudoustus TaxID=1810923 RepID=A0ABR4JG27_9EURO